MAPSKYKASPLLKDVKVGGWRALLWPYSTTPIVWAVTVAMLLWDFVKSPFTFFSRKERNDVTLPLPSDLKGLKSEMLDIGGGIKIHAASFGRAPDKPLMLFVHGFPELWYSWRHQLTAFKKDYEVVAIDMRGYNLSSKPEGIESYSMEAITSDIPRIVAALGRERCVLVAHDWGGAIAWTVAGMYPALVERLIVLAAPNLLMYNLNADFEQRMKSMYFLMFQLPWFAEQLFLFNDSQLVDKMFQGGPPSGPYTFGAVDDQDLEFYKQAIQRPGAITSMLNYYRALVRANLGWLPSSEEVQRGMAALLEMPVLVIWGAQDHALLPLLLTGVESVAPESEVHILQGCSHWVQQDKPEEVNTIMADWLQAKGGAEAIKK